MTEHLKYKELGKLEVCIQDKYKDRPCYRHDIIYEDCISSGLDCEKCYYRLVNSSEAYLK